MDTEKSASVVRAGHRALKVKTAPGVLSDLRAEAKRRGVGYDKLAAEIIDAVVNHKLFAAVLDH
jgi:hypothetical protein